MPWKAAERGGEKGGGVVFTVQVHCDAVSSGWAFDRCVVVWGVPGQPVKANK